MRKIKEVLRLKWACGLSNRQIARSCGISRSVVAEYLRRAVEAGLSWPLPEELDDGAIEHLLFPSPPSMLATERTMPVWADINLELKGKGVTLFLLWHEYKERYPEGYQYSRFCELYRDWAGKLDLSMRQEHKAGEKMFVDYGGQTVPVVNRDTGEIREAQIFVAVLAASNYTYAEATWTQGLSDWISSHVRAFEFFGGVPELVIPDNLKSGVTTACRYDPDINPIYQDLATHYGTAVMPARVGKPQDKAKVETGVQVVQRWILARLRHRTFFSLFELNQAIHSLLEELNRRPFKKIPGSRRSLYESLEKPALKPIPGEPYTYAEWFKGRVHVDYHIEVDRHFYSVPYQLYKRELDVRLTSRTVEFFHKSRRVASHQRSYLAGKFTTLKEHMPTAHRQYAEWTPERMSRWAKEAGPWTVKAVEAIMASRPHPQQGFRACLGVMRLGKSFGADRLEAACNRAMICGAASYRSIKSILATGLDKEPLREKTAMPLPINHANIRGADYYGGERLC